MQLEIEGLDDGGWIPERFAFAVPDADRHTRPGANRNPGITWRQCPPGSRTLALLMYDDDVPRELELVNREGRTIPPDAPRGRFYHWVMVDLPPGTQQIYEGTTSDGVISGGKRDPAGPVGSRQGLNGYTEFLQDDPDLGGRYVGYDGPCPPWNDERIHRYHFVIHATDLNGFPVEGEFRGPDVEAALEGHVLASARVTGVYSLYPPLLERRGGGEAS